MSGEIKNKVVQFPAPARHETVTGDYRGKEGPVAEVIPVDFGRQAIIQRLSGAPVEFAFVPSQYDAGFDFIITIPPWVEALVTSVGLKKDPGLGTDPNEPRPDDVV